MIVYGGRREARERKELMNRKKSAIQVFKNKIQLSKSEDVIAFIEWFMNQATSSLAHRCSKELYKMKDFHRMEGGAGSYQQRKRSDCF